MKSSHDLHCCRFDQLVFQILHFLTLIALDDLFKFFKGYKLLFILLIHLCLSLRQKCFDT
jgi:hypothetical protein